MDGVERLGVDEETELRGEADGAHHTQGVVAEGDIRIERCSYCQLLHVVESAKRVYQFAVSRLVQAEGKGVDGEVAPVLVVLEGSVLDDWLAAVVAVRLFPGANKFQLEVAAFHLGRTEILEYREVGATSEFLGDQLGQFYATPDGDDIDIFGWAVEIDVADITTDYVSFQSQLVGRFGSDLERLRRNVFQ